MASNPLIVSPSQFADHAGHDHKHGHDHSEHDHGPKVNPDGTIDSAAYGIAANASGFMKLRQDVQRTLDGWSTGKIDSKKARRDLERKYMRILRQRQVGEGPNVAGGKELTIAYKHSNGEISRHFWDWVPLPTGPSVVGVCPECFLAAPSQTDPNTRTRPTFFEERLFYIKGDPEADAKMVVFKLQHPIFHMYLDDRNRLTVREIIRCPSGRHGPNQKLVRRCDWAVRVEDGIATRLSSRVLRSGESRGSAGPLIIVK